MNRGQLLRKFIGSKFEPSLLDLFPNAFFAYSSLQLSLNEALLSSRGRRNSNNAEQNFTPKELIDGTLTTFSESTLVQSPTLYDQSGNARNLTRTVASAQPELTDANGVALGHFKSSVTGRGWFNTAIQPTTVSDFVVGYVFRNQTVAFNQRTAFYFKVSPTNCFAFHCARSGSSYIIGHNLNNENSATADQSFTFTPNNITNDWVLVTYARIGGVLTLYVNGIARTLVNGGIGPDARGISGTYLNISAVTNSIGPIQDLRTAILYNQSDLSAFNIAGFNAKMMELHGIA
jgi:hypothetical protein